MSRLTVYNENDTETPILDTRDADAISAELDKVGVLFERWPAEHALPADATAEQIGEAYAADIERLQAQFGYQTWDVIGIHPQHPDKDAMRAKFLDEHSHSEDEVRFFVDGAGLFTLHIGGKVYATLCEANDLISVPADTHHWFDMGEAPHFKVIRLFNNQEGWVAKFTGTDIASEFRPAGEQILGQ
ncbi:1,2-dihydroxy-3-keto-5-methylthiopentene dioxygenase [Salinisphaera aquimarina]|uniref:Acireductone dioxygenase n=1 Tax=Salinisphaera aquimarina TaxID=2094031 RepID=A0ABV7EMA6_9GAMM